MKRVFIHIGYHKTASTFLQSNVFPQLPVNFLRLLGENEKYLTMLRYDDESSLDVNAIRSWLEKSAKRRDDIMVISHEALSGNSQGYTTPSAFSIARKLSMVFPDAKIIVVTRNQFDYITSLYTFRVAIKGYEYRSFSQFVEEEGKKGLFDYLEYHHLIAYYQRLFGSKNVLVLPMEMLGCSSKEMLEDITSFIQVPYSDIEMGTALNVSTKSSMILSFWRPLNYMYISLIHFASAILHRNKSSFLKWTARFYRFKEKTTRILMKFFKNSKKIDIRNDPKYAELVERFGVSNAHLQKITGRDFSVYGYPVKKD